MTVEGGTGQPLEAIIRGSKAYRRLSSISFAKAQRDASHRMVDVIADEIVC
jgi:hypothetical protein